MTTTDTTRPDTAISTQRQEAVRLFRALDRDALEALSLDWEHSTGYDSVPTIADHYDGLCAFPTCGFMRNDPVEMWLHVHLAEKHMPERVVLANLLHLAMTEHGLTPVENGSTGDV